jgi:hypothetical protein
MPRLLRLSNPALSAEDSGQNQPLQIGQRELLVLCGAHENRHDLTERHIDLPDRAGSIDATGTSEEMRR